jgi:prolyl-tRNA editing enzyme YbaK/EbsC (Cys-tRNA(Pro) deacylase)
VRSSSDVRNYLIDEDIAHEIVQLPGHSRTAAAAAELLGVSLAEVVKSLLFLAATAPVMVLVPGDVTVDTAALAAELAAADVTLAKAPQVLELTGYRRGAVPPVALEHDIPMIADPRVFDPAVVYCGGGTTTTMLKIRSADLKALVRPRLAPVGTRT